MNTYPRETVEFVGITVALNGAVVTTGIQFAITTFEQRPTTWVAAVILDGKTGVMITGLAPGVYTAYAKITASPETVIKEVAPFRIV